MTKKQAAKRQIRVASFSMSDISGSHRVAIFAGIVALLGSAVLAVASNTNARAVSDSKGAARLLQTAASQVITGTQTFASGGAAKLGMAFANGNQVNAAYRDVVSSANSLLVWPAVKEPAGNAYSAWNGLSSALNAFGPSMQMASDLSDALGKSTGQLGAIEKRLETSGRGTRAYESAVRLLSYGETGFGLASVRRVDYDLQVLQADLAAGELKQDAAFISPLVEISRAAAVAAEKLRKEDLSAAFDAATTAKASSESLSSAAAQSQAALLLGVASGLLSMFGLASVVYGLFGVTSEFSTRYARSVKQFRGEEEAAQELKGRLQALGAGALDRDIELTVEEGDMAELAALVNALLARFREALGSAAEAMGSGLKNHDQVLSIVGEAEDGGRAVVLRLASSQTELRECVESVSVLALDAQALLHAAGEASTRSIDATRIAQDAVSRVDSMREGLQETSKRIKRLGERSQEISAVVETLEVLSEQMGVVAFNAAIEAERAGEAGGGFRLVAAEAKRLAIRCEQSIGQISGVIQSVQADARAAAESVERSTAQVVSGANIGAVSHAMLHVVGPLAESVRMMAIEIDAGARAAAQTATESSATAEEARIAVANVVDGMSRLRLPVKGGQAALTSGIASLELVHGEPNSN